VTDGTDIGPARAEEFARFLGGMLPAGLRSVFDASFLRSHFLYGEFVYRLVLRVLHESGLAPALEAGGSAAEIAARAGLETGLAVTPLDWMARLVTARGRLEPLPGDPRGFRLTGPLPADDPGSVREEQRRHDPSWMPSYELAETVAGDYPAFLRGEISGEDVLFSPRRLRLWVDYFSNRNGMYAVSNRLGALAGAEWLPAGGGVILELGGGLGSGALALLDALRAAGRLPEVREYRFTELVPAFLRRGQDALKAADLGGAPIRFAALDMNRPFGEQGIAPASVAAVYAVNTLHVAHDLGFTLEEVRRALRPGGAVILSECVRPYPGYAVYTEFVFHLIQTFRAPLLDPVRRPNGGFLTPRQWKGALEAAGFADTRFLPDVVRIHGEISDFFVAAVGAIRPP
jgi:SAM-dependent methyltransferase